MAGDFPGRLTIFLGYAAGVGKTYKMLEDARRLRDSGADVVIGYFEPHARQDTIALTVGIEAVPTREIVYRGARFREMDTAAVLRRHPAYCVVDELAHANVPGAERAKRWEDVQVLRQAGIHVLSTLNVQHLESLNDQVWQISGVRVRETVPDWVVRQADEVVMVDLTPRALVHRIERGVVYEPEKARRALTNFFKESTLGALRELALRQTAHVVDVRGGDFLAEGVAAALLPEPSGDGAAAAETILINITALPATAMLIRRGKRVADFLRSGCYAVHVRDPRRPPAPDEDAAIGRHLNFARNLHIATHRLEGRDVAGALIEFARRHHVTQIFVARQDGRTLTNRIVRLARDMQVTICADRSRAHTAG